MSRGVLKSVLSALLICACAGFVLFLGTFQYGLVSGEEFAADTFQRRSYWYYELPLVRLKITPVVRDVQQNQLETMLLNKKYVVPNPPPRRWDLVSASRGSKSWKQGDAWILCQYLDAWDPNNDLTSFWETWTNDHPAKGKVLWPEIAALAQQELYVLIPPLFEEALKHDRAKGFQNDVNQVLARNYEALAAAELELGNPEAAAQFYSDALNHQPGRANSLLGREACYEQLGRTVDAARDRQAAAAQAEAE